MASSEQAKGVVVDESGLNPGELHAVMCQAHASRPDAVRALRKHGNVADAILELTEHAAVNDETLGADTPEPNTPDPCAAEISQHDTDGTVDDTDAEVDADELQVVVANTKASRSDAARALRKHGNTQDAILDPLPESPNLHDVLTHCDESTGDSDWRRAHMSSSCGYSNVLMPRRHFMPSLHRTSSFSAVAGATLRSHDRALPPGGTHDVR